MGIGQQELFCTARSFLGRRLLQDPTFIHPDKQNQGEREWLMKHNGGSVKDSKNSKLGPKRRRDAARHRTPSFWGCRGSPIPRKNGTRHIYESDVAFDSEMNDCCRGSVPLDQNLGAKICHPSCKALGPASHTVWQKAVLCNFRVFSTLDIT